ncbi:MAG: hypothetical protein JKX73_04035, partial [Flavobacteriales bacterium]|nr:hypothetical protein [Flavobacteriales bacterium]
MTIQRKTYLVAAFFFAVLLGVYANHFDNGFEFDDFHSIVNNAYIMDINNFFLFFTDGSTITTLQGNQSYRPISTLMNAIDYWIAGEMDPFQFHLQIFFWYLVLGLMLFLFVRKCLQYAGEHPWNNMVSVFVVSWFMLHTANAETVNYIGARSDGFSTLCVIASFVLFQNSTGRKYHLYLLTMLLGIFTKQTGVMFIGLLFFYIYFFEENASLKDMFGLKRLDAFGRAFRKTLPALVVGGTIFIINQFVLTPEATNKWDVSVSKLDYFSTQWYVVLHYIGNFILPTSLSADPDLVIIQPIYDKRIIAGLIVIAAMLWVSYKTSLKKETRLIAFGILWFFIALLPTSSILPRFQIANDHRTFFPYIGLVISIGWAVALWLQKRIAEGESNKWLTSGVSVLATLIICSYGYGAHQRNIVWGNSELLWKDVTVKSPKN